MTEGDHGPRRIAEYGMRNAECGIFAAVLWVFASSAWAQTEGEARFFKDCPHRAMAHLHDERNPWDLHAVLYTTLGLSEVEVLRAVDWVIDLPLPGRPLRPFERSTEAIRMGYHRLPPWLVVRRTGELVGALQLHTLSFGDATATHSVGTGGVTGPGSGMVVRVSKLIDWTQHVTGDVNRLGGRLIGRSSGLVGWSMPARAVDGAQGLLLGAFHHLSVVAARACERTLSGVELGAETIMNIGRHPSHDETTVFLRLPMAVYREHELWILESRPQLVVGRPELFAQATHASLAHRRRPALRDWSVMDRPGDEESPVVIMTTTRAIARAPASLKSYVVPAAWILDAPSQRHAY